MYGPKRQMRRGYRQRAFPAASRPRGRSGGIRIIIGLVMAGFALFSYLGSSTYNPVTGEKQYVSVTPEQEVALGIQSAPHMAQRHGGLHPDRQAQARVDAVGNKLVHSGPAGDGPYKYEFHLLADDRTVNAFALPGGQVFITAALYNRLSTEGQLAGVLGHEIGHVVARHGAQRISQQKLTQGLTGAVVLSTYDPSNPRSQATAQVAMVVGNLISMKYGRDDELESDALGVRFMADANYDPRALIEVMQILEQASGGSRQAEFFSTHPNPDNRVAKIEQEIRERYPNGIPGGLIP